MRLNDYIKSLSLKDKKTLSQKGLKLAEEVGELAKAILPYDSAHGTNHRFIDKEKILEEVVDVYLTNISIAHSLGITEDEFNDMLAKKSEKWNELQSREEKAEFPLPFEIHVTIDATNVIEKDLSTGKFEIDTFRKACEIIGVKPIVLDLEINDGSILKDVMTSSKHFGDNKSAYIECERIAFELDLHGYKVVRKKIETVPWHPGAPVISTGKEIPNSCYFESHIGVIINPSKKSELNNFVENVLNSEDVELWGSVKLSQNFFKKSNNGEDFVNMLTYRCNKIGSPTFKLQVETIKELLKQNGFDFEKVEVEYAIYDTNVTHDVKWITG